MPKYLLRSVRQVVVLELTGHEEVVEADSQAQLNVLAREFLTAEFPDEPGPPPGVEIEIRRQPDDAAASSAPPEDFKPVNRGRVDPGPMPF